ncbi:DUF1015 family protein [Kutzneria viridogrisea]|nr:DUF1015 family protein [Kutzneria albida]MBA8928551.1 hypothetical protein [Kutzneria viridogrisea]
MSGWVRPVRDGWVARGGVPGPDVDEFAEPDRVIAALAAAGAERGSLLAVQHPHRTPTALASGFGLADALPIARTALAHLRANHYRRVHQVVAPYRVDGPDGTAHGLLCVVDPEAVGPDGLSRVRHTEEVYPNVVAERAAMLAGLGCATSAALLVPVEGGPVLTQLVDQTCADLGDPAVSIVDSGGRRHQLWLQGPGPRQDELIAWAQDQSLLVADGNHRVAAATAAGRGALLALITGGPRLRVGAIHRALVGTGLDAAELARRWRAAGLAVSQVSDPAPPLVPGVVVVLAGDTVLRVTLPDLGALEPEPRIDHGLVEQLLVREALGVDPDGPALRPLPAGRLPGPGVDAVLLLAPVPYADVLAVHAEGQRMPRKATYFTPKPHSGLLLADL